MTDLAFPGGVRILPLHLGGRATPPSILDISCTSISGGVEVLTGRLMKFSPREYHVQMVEEGTSPTSPDVQRALELYRFALTNYRDLQPEVARGGADRARVRAGARSHPGGQSGPASVSDRKSRAPVE